MTETVIYSHCPACKSNGILPVLDAEDHTVSHEIFPIWECQSCTLRFTQQVPGPGKIGRYYQSEEYISHTDTRKGFVNRLYHLVRRHTLRSKRSLVQRKVKEQTGKLLDIGAGTGAFAHVMQQAGWEVTGLEPDPAARELARNLYQLQLRDPEDLFVLEKESFLAITLWHVLEHVHELDRYLQTCFRILKRNGVLLVAVPNYTSFDAGYYGADWAAYDVPRHLYHFSPRSMEKLMQRHGFQVESFLPMWFDSFYVSLLSEKYKKGSRSSLGALRTGFRSNLKALAHPKNCSSVIYVMRKG